MEDCEILCISKVRLGIKGNEELVTVTLFYVKPIDFILEKKIIDLKWEYL